jgi:hypothetical protein
MGILRSTVNHQHLAVGAVTLGAPAAYAGGRCVDRDQEPDEYRWEDSRLPNGVIDPDGTVIPDPVEL